MSATKPRRRPNGDPPGLHNGAVSARKARPGQNRQGASHASPQLPEFLKKHAPSQQRESHDPSIAGERQSQVLTFRQVLAAATVVHKPWPGASSSTHSPSNANHAVVNEAGASSTNVGLIRITDEFAIDPSKLPFDIKDHTTWHPYSDLAAWLDTPVKTGTWDSSNQWTRKAIGGYPYSMNLEQEKPPNDLKIYVSREAPNDQSSKKLPVADTSTNTPIVSPAPVHQAPDDQSFKKLPVADTPTNTPIVSPAPVHQAPEDQSPKKKLPLADTSTNTPVNSPASVHRPGDKSQTSAPISAKATLVTNAHLFLSQLQPAPSKTAKAPDPTGNTSHTASAIMSQQNAQKSSASMIEGGSQKEPRSDLELAKGDSTSTIPDEIVAGIIAKALIVKEPMQPSDSVLSVRGKADQRLSTIAGSLRFSDAFKGRDASEESEVIFKGRITKKFFPSKLHGAKEGDGRPGWSNVKPINYESNQLRGWDGNWQPAPIEWDRRDMYDYSRPEHQVAIKAFIIDRYLAFKKGLCPTLDILEDVSFQEGHSLAVGLSHFEPRIDPSEHHHIPPDDPFSLMKCQNNAALSVKNYCRVHKIAEKQEEEARKHERRLRLKTMTKEERLAEQVAAEQAREEAIRQLPPNPFKPKLNIFVRPAHIKDLAQIRDIHNHYIRTSAVTAERIELTEVEWCSRFDNCNLEKYPFLVAVSRRHGRVEKIVGFTYAEDFAGELTMWRHTCELQVYVDPVHVNQGVGKNLMDCILRGTNPRYRCKQAVEFVFDPMRTTRFDLGGERIVRNIVFAIPFAASEERQATWIGEWIARIFGFELQGVLKEIGYKESDDNPISLAYYVLATEKGQRQFQGCVPVIDKYDLLKPLQDFISVLIEGSLILQESILLSDVLGLSLLVDSLTHPKPPQATPGTVLGPFHHPDPPSLPTGSLISHDQNGEQCLVLCTVASSSGAPVPDVEIDIWETDSSGHYDTQYPNRAEGTKGLDGRGVMKSDSMGKFWFKGIMPVEYPIPDDGPVGLLLGKLGDRSVYRPAHVHFWLRKKGWDDLVTALYISTSPNLKTDPVFGVKAALIVGTIPASSELAAQYDVPEGMKTIKYDFVMVSEEEVRSLREERIKGKMEELRKKGVDVDGVD
ncbi:MAG: hypothetical protein Q9222_004464 [Ikaeria aurantiellina]